MLLEFSQYLENYLWPNYSSLSSAAHALSIAVLVNEKFRERTPSWEVSFNFSFSLSLSVADYLTFSSFNSQ